MKKGFKIIIAGGILIIMGGFISGLSESSVYYFLGRMRIERKK